MELNNNTSLFRFEDLRIYSKAIDYSKWLLATLKEPRNAMEKNLFDSFLHSSYDIALNIAEGSSRNKSQFEHYLKISKTAIRECIVYTAIAYGNGLLDEEENTTSRELLMELTRMIGALIISLQKGTRRTHEDEPESAPSPLDDIETSFNTDFPELDN